MCWRAENMLFLLCKFNWIETIQPSISVVPLVLNTKWPNVGYSSIRMIWLKFLVFSQGLTRLCRTLCTSWSPASSKVRAQRQNRLRVLTDVCFRSDSALAHFFMIIIFHCGRPAVTGHWNKCGSTSADKKRGNKNRYETYHFKPTNISTKTCLDFSVFRCFLSAWSVRNAVLWLLSSDHIYWVFFNFVKCSFRAFILCQTECKPLKVGQKDLCLFCCSVSYNIHSCKVK